MRFSRSWPCAVPMSVTPRSAIVRHAAASSSVPISSTMMISGVWFSTASIITLCCCEGSGTCIRRAPPMAGCGTSPSPPISLLVSMITTRLPWRSLKTRASSRMTVVFPTPGRPRNKMLSLPSASRSSIMSTCPFSARPTRQVRPTTEPERLRMAEMRCSVPAMPARLSPPKSPIAAIAASKSPRVTGSARRHWLGAPFAKRASGQRPRSSTTSSRSPRRACVNNASRTSTGSICASVAGSDRRCVKGVFVSRRCSQR